MSLKTIPGLGKSGMSRMYCLRSKSTSDSARNLPQIPNEQQVLQMGRHGHEILEGLYCLLALLRVAGAQGRGEDLLKQCRLAVGRRAEHAQIAAADAVARQLGDRADDLALGLVVALHARTELALDHAVLLELAHELGIGVRVF